MFQITKKDSNSQARCGILTTKHGHIETPAYTIVATHGEVRCLTPSDLNATDTQVVIANTYHLWQTLGDALDTYEGLHTTMQWEKPIMTDSGGFQIFSLGFAREHGIGKLANIFPEDDPRKLLPEASYRGSTSIEKNLVRITDDGAHFTTDDGTEHFLGPKESIHIQEKLGADIILAFDECTSPLNTYEYTKEALARTHTWAKICLEKKTRDDQLLYGITQGGEYKDLREESAKYIGELPFDGFAIGGSLGQSRNDMLDVLRWTIPILPEDKPRHFLGIGKIEDIFDSVEQGIDTFDCVIPTREARHGRIWTTDMHTGPDTQKPRHHFDIKKGIYAKNTTPLDPNCTCPICEKGTTKKDLHELFKAKDPNAAKYATIHNIHFFTTLMSEIRKAIKEEKLQALREHYLKTK